MATVDVLIPTYRRPGALAVTLASLAAQTFGDFRVVLSDQTEEFSAADSAEVKAVLRLLELQGHEPRALRHLPRRGLAEQRHFLLSQGSARYVLFLDDDLILEPPVLWRLVSTLEEQGCGFVGAAPIGLSYRDDVRPHEQPLEVWDGPVQPEEVMPGTDRWQRHRLHNAANILHVEQRLGLRAEDRRLYKVAWLGGCVLFDREKLCRAGGFDFWPELPEEHCGEDVLAQLRVMSAYGGCGVLPSGVYHQELPTTVPNRAFDAPHALAHLTPRSKVEAGEATRPA